MRTTSLLLSATAALALTACASGNDPSLARVTPESAEVVSLAEWDYDELADGLHAERVIGLPVLGSGGSQIGEVENLVVGPDGRIQAVLVEAGGFLDIGDTEFRVPWNEVRFVGNRDAIRVPVDRANIQHYGLFAEGAGAGETGPRQWKATELLDDYVTLEDGPYGIVTDLVFNREGLLQAVVVAPDVTYGAVGPVAYPFYGYGWGFDPGLDTYGLPYGIADAGALGPYDMGAF